MAVLSQEFGGIELSDQDATTFLRQVSDAKPSTQAANNLVRGRELLAQLDRHVKAASTLKDRGK